MQSRAWFGSSIVLGMLALAAGVVVSLVPRPSLECFLTLALGAAAGAGSTTLLVVAWGRFRPRRVTVMGSFLIAVGLFLVWQVIFLSIPMLVLPNRPAVSLYFGASGLGLIVMAVRMRDLPIPVDDRNGVGSRDSTTADADESLAERVVGQIQGVLVLAGFPLFIAGTVAQDTFAIALGVGCFLLAWGLPALTRVLGGPTVYGTYDFRHPRRPVKPRMTERKATLIMVGGIALMATATIGLAVFLNGGW